MQTVKPVHHSMSDAFPLSSGHFGTYSFLENAPKGQHPKGIESLSPAVATLMILRGYPG